MSVGADHVLRGSGGCGGEEFEELVAGGLDVFGEEGLPVAAEKGTQRGVVDVGQADAAERAEAE